MQRRNQECAIISPGSLAERDRLFWYLKGRGAKWSSGRDLFDPNALPNDPDECYRYNEGGNFVIHDTRRFYINNKSMYSWPRNLFLCSVDDFIQYIEENNENDLALVDNVGVEMLFM